MNKVEIGARIRMNQDYGYTASKGDMGTVTGETISGCTPIRFDNGNEHAGVHVSRFDVAASFKVGDKVRVVRKVIEQPGWCNTWVSSMDSRVGRTDTVTHVSDSAGVALADGYSFPTSSLELVKEPVEEPVKAPHVFFVGDEGKTGGGDSYKVVFIHNNTEQPVVAEVTDRTDGEVTLETYSTDGVFLRDGETSSLDLIAPKKTVTTYLNVYASGSVYAHHSAAGAHRSAQSDSVLVAHPVTIELP